MTKRKRETPIEKALRFGVDYSIGPSRSVAVLRNTDGALKPVDLSEIEIRVLAAEIGEFMSARLAKFERLKTHAWHGRTMRKLKRKQIEEIESFIRAHDHLDFNAFAGAVNRWGLDSPEKPTPAQVEIALAVNVTDQ